MTNWFQLKTLYFFEQLGMISPNNILVTFSHWYTVGRPAFLLFLKSATISLSDVVPRKSFVNFGFRLLSLKLWLDSESILQQRCAPHSAVQCWSGSNCVVIPRIWKEFIIFPQIRNLTSQQKSFKQTKNQNSKPIILRKFPNYNLLIDNFDNYSSNLIISDD